MTDFPEKLLVPKPGSWWIIENTYGGIIRDRRFAFFNMKNGEMCFLNIGNDRWFPRSECVLIREASLWTPEERQGLDEIYERVKARLDEGALTQLDAAAKTVREGGEP